MKKFLLISFLFSFLIIKAQKIESISVNLYTDSLKKGTYNYINVDGLLANGRYLPLDSTEIIFSSSSGKFHGNSLWLDKDCKLEKVSIKVMMRNNPEINKNFVMYVKKKEDDQNLPSEEQLMNEMKKRKKRGAQNLE